jgi:hypothetical protein
LPNFRKEVKLSTNILSEERPRRLTLLDSWSNKPFLVVEGVIWIDRRDEKSLIVNCKIGEEKYKQHGVFHRENFYFIVEEMSEHPDEPYHHVFRYMN